MRRVLATLAVLAALGAMAGAAVVGFGLYNVSARAGHWGPTTWALHTTFRNAVALRSPPASAVPPLTEEMARLGALHFDGACRICHGAPGETRSWTIRSMVPVPPPIQEAAGSWSPEELFWIVRHGVKMSGMPHWPSVREDEVWHVVAFLTRVEEMDPATYADWTARPEAPADAAPGLAFCAGCHGVDGQSRNPHVPRLDLQGEAYLLESLAAFLDRRRESGIMSHAASVVPPEALPALAAWYAAQPPGADPALADPALPDPELAARGEALARAAPADLLVPACTACHGPRSGGAADPPPGGPGPAIAGQPAEYLATQLRLWREGLRGGGPRAELMRKAALHLTEEDIAALSAWYAALPPEAPGD